MHYGWVIVSLCILGNMVGAGTTFWTMAVYIPLIADEFESTRTAVVSAFTVGQITFAVIAPFIGTYFDRKGARGSIFFREYTRGYGVPINFTSRDGISSVSRVDFTFSY
jgi:MFS-type transporter involved in bile tolerance (Atg22 family)